MTRTFRLPTGDITTDSHQYCMAWQAISTPIERALGLTLIGYDPDLIFASDKSPIMMPVSVAKKLADHLEGQRQKIAELTNTTQQYKATLIKVQDQIVEQWYDLPTAYALPAHQHITNVLAGRDIIKPPSNTSE